MKDKITEAFEKGFVKGALSMDYAEVVFSKDKLEKLPKVVDPDGRLLVYLDDVLDMFKR